jgi:MFS family permease
MWSYMLAPPPLQAEFGVARADASLPCTFVMIGFATGGVLMGRLADHFGVAVPVAIMFPGFVMSAFYGVLC